MRTSLIGIFVELMIIIAYVVGLSGIRITMDAPRFWGLLVLIIASFINGYMSRRGK